MKKIEKLFVEFPELRIIEDWIKFQLKEKGRNVIKNLYKNYRVRKPIAKDVSILPSLA